MKTKVIFFQDNFIEAIGAGIYEICVEKNGKSKSLYIGESISVMIRCAGHLYRLKKKADYFGFTEETISNPDITLKFELIESNNDKRTRLKIEKERISERNPLSQKENSHNQKSPEDKIEALLHFLNVDCKEKQ